MDHSVMQHVKVNRYKHILYFVSKRKFWYVSKSYLFNYDTFYDMFFYIYYSFCYLHKGITVSENNLIFKVHVYTTYMKYNSIKESCYKINKKHHDKDISLCIK